MDGKKVAESLYAKTLLDISLLPQVPKLVVILVGQDPASQTYVKSKTKKCLDLGLVGETISLPDTTSEAELLAQIANLNNDKSVHGILVQLPLPKTISKENVIQAIHPLKDVDGLHPENAGRLISDQPRLVPCTPAGVIEMLKFYQIEMEGKRAVVLGRSEIVGKPMALLLLRQNATVTICHSKTQDLPSVTREADILIAAVGRPRFVTADMVKDGAVVVDVGIHREPSGLVGDVDFASVSAKAGYLSPVPGGVGPLTIALLMRNLVTAAGLQAS